MRLKYENTSEDVLALRNVNYARSPILKKRIASLKWRGAVWTFILLCFIVRNHPLLTNIVLSLIGAGIYTIVFPIFLKWSIKADALQKNNKTIHKGFLCEHELEICEDGLIERTDYNETKIPWTAVERIESTAEHTFIYTGALSAHVIPQKRIDPLEYKTFLLELGNRFKSEQIIK